MAGPKRVPVEVVQRAKQAAALTKHYTVAKKVEPVAEPVKVLKPKGAREKVVAALKRLHPMD